MDEVKFKHVYNQACYAAVGITDVDPAKASANAQRTVLLILQLLESVQAQIDDMSLDDC
jgi:hypothetical protein